jgi:alpha-glucoside transport system substrate-binding protein
MNSKRTFWAFLALTLLLALMLAACGGEEATPTEAPPPTEPPPAEVAPTEPPVAELPVGECTTELWTAIPGGALEKAYNGELTGKVVTMMGPFTEGDIVRFEQSIKAFEEKTGIDIQYEGTKEFEATIGVRVGAGDVPDIVDFPQPGLLAGFFKEGKFIDPTTFLPAAYLAQQYNQGWLDMGMMAGPEGPGVGGIWARYNGKSQVWYPKDDFDAAGYQIPTSWEELLALSDQIVSDGDTPWCVGIESGAATGWPATDWMEEFMLRTTTPENYDKWVSGELNFDSPEVRNALTKLSELWLKEGYVFGGQEAITTTFFGDAPAPMFEQPPKCWLHKQGNFITAFFPEGVKVGEDYDFFYLPGIDPQFGNPYLVAGDIYAMWRDAPEVRAVYEYFTKGESLKEWLAAGGALAPQNDTCLDWYTDPVEKKIAGLVAGASTVRFDASDLMPGAVGSGSFWKGMTDYFSGAADMDTVLQEIDASWPQ